MKKLRYTFNGNPVEMGWNEVNEEIAKAEADNGEYEIIDDGQPAPEETPNAEQQLDELAAAIERGLTT